MVIDEDRWWSMAVGSGRRGSGDSGGRDGVVRRRQPNAVSKMATLRQSVCPAAYPPTVGPICA